MVARGHLKSRTTAADWGDFKSFTEHMKHMAGNLGVDCFSIDTGNNQFVIAPFMIHADIASPR